MPILRTLLASLLLLWAGGAALSRRHRRFPGFHHRNRAPYGGTRDPVDGSGGAAGNPVRRANQPGRAAREMAAGRLRLHPLHQLLPGARRRIRATAGPARRTLAEGRVQLLSISFDPAHDTPANSPRICSDPIAAARLAGRRPPGAHGSAELVRIFGVTVVPERSGGFVTTPPSLSSTHGAGWSQSSIWATWVASPGHAAGSRPMIATAASPPALAALLRGLAAAAGRDGAGISMTRRCWCRSRC